LYKKESTIASFEKKRPEAWDKAQAKLQGKINNFQLKGSVVSPPEINGDTAMIKAYEFMTFTWKDSKGKEIESGIGIPHEFKASLNNEKWEVIDDSYDEGPLTDVIYNKQDRTKMSSPVNQLNSDFSIQSIQSANFSYNRAAAVGCADSYVYPNSNPVAHVNWPNYYNLSFRNYNPPAGGGDCANFVSQCLLYGNAPYQNAYNDTSNAWWYNMSNATASTTWTYCPSQINFFTSYFGGTQTSSVSNLAAGDLIYYDWTSDGVKDHVAIVVDPNGGSPLIDAHNWDVYHVPYYAIKTGSTSTVSLKF